MRRREEIKKREKSGGREDKKKAEERNAKWKNKSKGGIRRSEGRTDEDRKRRWVVKEGRNEEGETRRERLKIEGGTRERKRKSLR